MNSLAMDPYGRWLRLQLRNDWQHWRANAAESGFHLAAVLAAGVLGAWLLNTSFDYERQLCAWLYRQQPIASLATAGLLAAWAQRRSWQVQQRAWRDDWFAAQPVVGAVRLRRRALRAAAVAALHLAALALGCFLARATLNDSLLSAAAVLLASALGHSSVGWLRRAAPARQRREVAWQTRSRGSLWIWQAIEAGAALAPKRLAWLLLALLLMPRGPALLILPAIALIALLALAHAWQRSLDVLPAAATLLAAQPVPARQWLRQSLAFPLSLLLSLLLAGSGFGYAIDSPLLGGVIGASVLLLGLLHWACSAAFCRQPRRGRQAYLLHSAVLLSVAHALPPLAALLWPLQMAWLLRRITRL